MTAPAPRHRAPPTPRGIADWVVLVPGAVAVIAAVVAVASWLGPTPEPQEAVELPRGTVASGATRTLASLIVPTPTPTASTEGPGIALSAPSRFVQPAPRVPGTPRASTAHSEVQAQTPDAPPPDDEEPIPPDDEPAPPIEETEVVDTGEPPSATPTATPTETPDLIGELIDEETGEEP